MYIKYKNSCGEFGNLEGADIVRAMKAAEIRNAKNLTQAQLADIIGVDQPTISRMERGTGGTTLRTLQAAAEALECSVADLVDDDRTESERLLISLFRQLPSARKRGWIDMARLAAEEDQQSG
ncbi:helix-turn-helix transcriptional regulator [Pikeienuella sp. HZG-20]|uniref:helix-turn-helix domain-containing protein n=1 Tax=Paludibacillus litoralis TaxID=3133267 RepID=UPI0030EBD0A6